MMAEPDEMYRKFKTFLSGFLIRRVKGEFLADDFDEENSEYIRPHLEKLLPSLSLTEVMRIRVYFNDVFVYHLTDGMGKPTLPSQPPLSPIPIIEEDDGPPHPKRLKAQSQPEEISEVSSQINAQEQTPIETLGSTQRRKTAPLMQSTPLSVPIAMGGEADTLSDQPQGSTERRKTAPLMQSTPLSVPIIMGREADTLSDQQRAQDDFIADIISQINLSPIPQASDLPPLPNINKENLAQQGTISSLNVEQAEVTFLRGFADLLKERSGKRKQTSRTTRDRLLIVKPALSQPKEKKKRKDFEAICCLAQKQRTKEQIKRAKESFLHFMLVPGKTRNLIKRVINNVIVPEGQRGHIPMERIINLSNVMRAHASQRQSSIEQPGQISLTTLRSPRSPQALLRTSQLQPFTPIRGDVSSQSLGMGMDQISSFPTRSVLRQQPLLTIPERDSSIAIPLSPQLEEIPFTNSLISLPQLPENMSTIPSVIVEDQSTLSNLPRAIPEDVEMVDVHPQTSHGVVSIDNAVVPMQLDEIGPQVEVIPQNEVVPQVDVHEDNAHFSWFEILRPREDIVYPQVDGERRRKKKRRKREKEEQDVQPRRNHELPEIPMSPERSNFQNFPELPHTFSHQITEIQVPNYSQENEFDGYFDLIKEAGKVPEYRTWERFNPHLFSENDDFEMYTYIFKRMIKEDFVAMDTLYKEGTSRLEAAKGFRLILELKTMNLIEIDAVDTRIMGFRFKAVDDIGKC